MVKVHLNSYTWEARLHLSRLYMALFSQSLRYGSYLDAFTYKMVKGVLILYRVINPEDVGRVFYRACGSPVYHPIKVVVAGLLP